MEGDKYVRLPRVSDVLALYQHSDVGCSYCLLFASFCSIKKYLEQKLPFEKVYYSKELHLESRIFGSGNRTGLMNLGQYESKNECITAKTQLWNGR